MHFTFKGLHTANKLVSSLPSWVFKFFFFVKSNNQTGEAFETLRDHCTRPLLVGVHGYWLEEIAVPSLTFCLFVKQLLCMIMDRVVCGVWLYINNLSHVI